MLLPFRAFGDMRFKLTAKQIKDHIVPVYGHGALPSHYYSPPYVTVRPEIIHRRLNYKDKFLILATDGLWDLLTPEKVVQLIGKLPLVCFFISIFVSLSFFFLLLSIR